MKRVLSIFSLYIISTMLVLAQSVAVQAPSHVACGDNFRISYVVNTQDVDNFRMGNVPEGLEVITGPYTSRSQSYQIINGHTSSASSITFTYTLYAAKNGTYTIPAAKVVIAGKSVMSGSAKITVTGNQPQQNGHQQAPRMHDDYDDNMQQAGSRLSGNDLFVRVSANKKRVHEQEPILLTYKVYTQVDLTQLEGKMPDLTGFHTQEITLPQQKSFKLETIDGRTYRTVTWSQYVMFPQMTGKLEIPSITFKGIVVQRNRNVDPFEAFFNGGAGYVEVKRDVKAPAMTIQVDPLPNRPKDFSGGVGKFNITATVDKNEVKAGEPISLRVVVDGIGNLKLIKQPIIELPKDFDKYDPKITDKTKITHNGLEGSMMYDYLVVPRNQGKYTIPAIEFTYYDTSSNSYRTLKTHPISLNVLKGDGKSTISDFTSVEDNDIRGLKQGDVSLSKEDEYFFGSSVYIVWIIIPLLLFIIMVVIFRKRAMDNANVVMMRGKRANKVAAKRLRTAALLIRKGHQNEFYDEVLRALWGYVSDKLNMPVSQLSRDNILEKLSMHHIDQDTVYTFLEAIDECEFARFAPGDPKGKMDIVYEKAAKAITDIDNMLNLKGNKKNKSLAVIIILFFACSMSLNAENTKQTADIEYTKGNYQAAIQQYNNLLREGVSADIYYNLGNAYFRTGNITQAVISYERANRLSPGDKDINFNLKFARNMTIDKIAHKSEMFFVTWYKSFVNLTSSNNWAKISIVLFLCTLLSLILYIFGSRLWMIKTSFYFAVFGFICFIATAFLSWQQKLYSQCRDGAIITTPSVAVKKTPSSGSADEMLLHEGTRVDITDRNIKGWYGIRLSDGREGWLLINQVEVI